MQPAGVVNEASVSAAMQGGPPDVIASPVAAAAPEQPPQSTTSQPPATPGEERDTNPAISEPPPTSPDPVRMRALLAEHKPLASNWAEAAQDPLLRPLYLRGWLRAHLKEKPPRWRTCTPSMRDTYWSMEDNRLQNLARLESIDIRHAESRALIKRGIMVFVDNERLDDQHERELRQRLGEEITSLCHELLTKPPLQNNASQSSG